MSTKISFLTLLFFAVLNTQGQNFIDLINQKKNLQLIFKNNLVNSNFQQKLTNVSKQKLDSTVNEYPMFDMFYKSEYIYDSIGRNRQVNIKEKNFDQWTISHKFENIFDDNDYLSKIFGSSLDYDNNWVKYSERAFTYDTCGNLTSEIEFEEWNLVSNNWEYGYKYEYSYDSISRLVLETNYDWESTGMDWILNGKIEYTYDSISRLILETYYYWDSNSSQWQNSSKYEYCYDFNGNLLQYIDYEWIESLNKWVEYYKEDYSYDEYNNMIVSIGWDYDEATEQWQYSSKIECAYDINNNITQITGYEWDLNENTWVNDMKAELIYNTLYDFSDLILPIKLYEGPYEMELPETNNMLTQFKIYEVDGGLEFEFYSVTLYYSEQNIGIEEVNSTTVNVYPNPASSYITIQPLLSDNTGVFELYDIKGNKIISLTFSEKTQVSTDDLQSGFYFYNIISKENRTSGKLIIN